MESNVVWLLLLAVGVAQGQRKFNTSYCCITHNDCATLITVNSMQSTANTLHQTLACVEYIAIARAYGKL